MKAQWQVPDSHPLADFAPTILLKAKHFATEITIFNARQHQMDSEQVISTEHITNNKAVRNTLLDRGIRPEALPPEEDVKKVERRLASEDKMPSTSQTDWTAKSLKVALFAIFLIATRAYSTGVSNLFAPYLWPKSRAKG